MRPQSQRKIEKLSNVLLILKAGPVTSAHPWRRPLWGVLLIWGAMAPLHPFPLRWWRGSASPSLWVEGQLGPCLLGSGVRRLCSLSLPKRSSKVEFGSQRCPVRQGYKFMSSTGSKQPFFQWLGKMICPMLGTSKEAGLVVLKGILPYGAPGWLSR